MGKGNKPAPDGKDKRSAPAPSKPTSDNKGSGGSRTGKGKGG